MKNRLMIISYLVVFTVFVCCLTACGKKNNNINTENTANSQVKITEDMFNSENAFSVSESTRQSTESQSTEKNTVVQNTSSPETTVTPERTTSALQKTTGGFWFIKPEIMAPPKYESTAETGGSIEAKYISGGKYDISYFEEKVSEPWEKYEIYYPKSLSYENKKFPVIVMSNGSGVKGSRYFAVFQHYASWGFIVIGNEHDTAFAGEASDASLLYLINANNDPKSIFYKKIDLDNIGIVGHSQGGVGVFNAIIKQPNGNRYKAAVSLSPIPEESAKAIRWTYEPQKVTVPIMVLAGTNNDTIALEPMQQLFSHIKSDKVMARRSNTNHPEMLYSADGYVTAWFMWQLQNDKDAAKAFVGESPELLNNSFYQDQKISIK